CDRSNFPQAHAQHAKVGAEEAFAGGSLRNAIDPGKSSGPSSQCHAPSIETTCPNGTLRASIEAQITGYGGASLGNVPHRSVRNTSACGIMQFSLSHSKHGRK